MNPYYLVWEFVYYLYDFVKDKCLSLVTSQDRSTIETAYRALSGFRDDLMTHDDALWRYFEHLKSFFELLDLMLKVSVCSGDWTPGFDIDSDGWPNPRWIDANYFPLEG